MGAVEPMMVARSQRRCDILHSHDVVRLPYEADLVTRLSEAPVGGFARREQDCDGSNMNWQWGGGLGKVRLR